MSKKPNRYKDIYIASGLKKDYLSDDEVFATAYAKTQSVEKFNKSQIVAKNNTSKYKNIAGLDGFVFQDSEDIDFRTLNLFYTRQNIYKNLAIGVDGGVFSIQKKGVAKYDGIAYGVSLLLEGFKLRVGINNFEDFSEVVPTLSYQNSYNGHNYALEYTHQNALFYTYSLCPYEQKIDVEHFNVSDYKSFKNNTDLWMSLDLNLFENSDTEVTAQYDWRFYHGSFFRQKFSYHTALEGWYTTHTNPNGCFYSPKFSDATLLRVDPVFRFSNQISLKGQFGVGYSFEENTVPYKYGAWAFGDILKDFSYNVGCLYSNISRLSSSGNYNYKECRLNMGYKW